MAEGARLRHRIQARVGILLAVGMLGPLAAFVWLNSGSRRELERHLVGAHTLIASLVAERLQARLSLEFEALQGVAESARDGDSAASASAALREWWVRHHALFDAVFLVDLEGRVLAQEPAPDQAVDGPRALGEVQRAGRPVFTDLLSTGPGSSHAYALIPIQARNGKLTGAVGGVIDPRSPRFASILKRYRTVDGESIDVVDGEGGVIASSDPARLLVRADPGAAEDGDLVAFATLSVARWRVAVRQPRSEALASSFAFSRDPALAFAAALLVALLFAWGASRSVTRPLSALTEAAERLTQGELSQPIPQVGEDEVGLLGLALERMRVALKDSQARIETANEALESRVAERTAELDLLNQQLRARKDAVHQLLGKVIRAQEDERRRVARELHDETTQSLTALVMRVETLATAAPPGLLREGLQATRGLVVRILDEVHRLIAGLRPSVLDDLGLKSAIQWYVEKHLVPRGIAVRCEIEGLDDRLPLQLETVVFRVVQEALTNIVKHAAASSVLVQAARKGDFLAIEIEDDGEGFNLDQRAAAAPDGSGWGLLGMRERVEMLHGELRIDSAPGEGTHLKLLVPLPDLPAHAATPEAAHG